MACETVSDGTGRFAVSLRAEDPMWLEATLEGHASILDSLEETSDLKLVLPRVPELSLLVVDAATGEPIETYRVSVDYEDGGNWIEEDYRWHPGGRASVSARPNADRLDVEAPGYTRAPCWPSTRECTVELPRGPTLRGRVVSRGEPVPHAAVLSVAGSFQEEDDDSLYGYAEVHRANALADAAGRFELRLDAWGWHTLELRGSGPAPTLVAIELPFEGDGDVDLGDVELVPGGSLAGRVALPPGADIAGLVVHVEGPAVRRRAVTDARGEFRVPDLPACPLALTVEGPRLGPAEDPDLELRLAPGEHEDLLVEPDPARLLCELTVRVRCGGAPLGDVDVLLAADGERDREELVGRTDEHGVARGRVVARAAAARLLVRGPLGRQAAWEECGGFPCSAGGDATVPIGGAQLELELEGGWLEVVWPARQPSGAMTLRLRGGDGNEESLSLHAYQLATVDVDGQECSSLRLGPISVGTYSVDLAVEASPDNGHPFQGGRAWHGASPAARAGSLPPELHGTAVVESGRTSVCRLEP